MVGFGNGGGKRAKDMSLPDPRPSMAPEPDHPDFYGETHGTAYPKVDVKKLEYQTLTDKITQIAHLMQSLTYGEMIKLADEIKAIDPEAQVIKPENTLAGVFHKWSEGK